MPPEPDFARRFRDACKAKQLKTTQKGLAQFFGVSEITARNWWHGEKLPGMANARKVAEKLDVNTEWLLSGRGPMRVEEVHGNVRPAHFSQREYPVISRAEAGEFAEVIRSHEPGDYEVAYPAPIGINCSIYSFWTQVSGRSMMSLTGGRSFPHGSYIFVDPEIRDCQTGALVLAKLDETEEVTFKQLNVEGDRIYLEPLNTQYQVIEIASGSQIIGTVLSAIVSV